MTRKRIDGVFALFVTTRLISFFHFRLSFHTPFKTTYAEIDNYSLAEKITLAEEAGLLSPISVMYELMDTYITRCLRPTTVHRSMENAAPSLAALSRTLSRRLSNSVYKSLRDAGLPLMTTKHVRRSNPPPITEGRGLVHTWLANFLNQSVAGRAVNAAMPSWQAKYGGSVVEVMVSIAIDGTPLAPAIGSVGNVVTGLLPPPTLAELEQLEGMALDQRIAWLSTKQVICGMHVVFFADLIAGASGPVGVFYATKGGDAASVKAMVDQVKDAAMKTCAQCAAEGCECVRSSPRARLRTASALHVPLSEFRPVSQRTMIDHAKVAAPWARSASGPRLWRYLRIVRVVS